MKSFCITLLFIGILSSLFSNKLLADVNMVNFTFCYEQQEFLPHFRGNSIYLSNENPGAAIEIVQLIDRQIPDVNINFVRDNWPRCLKGLENGSVSGVVGSYSRNRTRTSQYPYKNNKLDLERSFSYISICLFHHQEDDIQWDGQSLTYSSFLSVSVPRGYKTVEVLQQYDVQVYQTDTTARAHNLLLTRKVNATTAQCEYTGFPKNIVRLMPPIRKEHGFLIISKQFYRKHSTLAEKIWRHLAEIDQEKIYDKYRSK